MDAREREVHPVSGHSGLWFALVALPFIVAIGLFAALQPIPRAASTGAVTAAVGSFDHRGRWDDRSWGHSQWGERTNAPRRWPADHLYRRPMHFRAAPAAYPVDGAPALGLDGGRFLMALSLGTGLAGVLWAASNGRTGQTLVDPTEATAAREVTVLREEVDRLRSEQRQLRLSLDWQERLLTAANSRQPDAPSNPPEASADC